MDARVQGPIMLRSLRIAELREALRMTEEAHYNDPVQRYLRDTPDASTSWFRTEWTLNLGIRLAHHIRKGRVLTVGDVDGKVWYISGGDADDKLDKLTLGIAPTVSPHLLSTIQKKRQDAFRKLFFDTLEDSLGERRKEMIELGGLATRPSRQGRGLGSALVKAVTDLGDKEGRAVWLGSSNIGNTPFYERYGFATIATVTLGEDDPTWDEPPIVLKLMLREPRAAS